MERNLTQSNRLRKGIAGSLAIAYFCIAVLASAHVHLHAHAGAQGEESCHVSELALGKTPCCPHDAGQGDCAASESECSICHFIFVGHSEAAAASLVPFDHATADYGLFAVSRCIQTLHTNYPSRAPPLFS